MDIHSRYATLGSAFQPVATTTEQNDSSSSPQIDKADTNLSFESTRNDGQIGETTTFIPAPTPSSPLSFTPASPPFSSTLISEVPMEQTYGTHELSENKTQLAYPPSDGTDASRLPPLVPVRRPSQYQPNDQTHLATTSPPVAQNTSSKVSYAPTPASSAAPQDYQLPSQYSQELYRVPTVQTPQIRSSRTSDNIYAPKMPGESSPSLISQQDTTPLQQSVPTTPSMYSGIPSQSYGLSQGVVTPQPHSSGPTQPFIPPAPSITPQTSQSIYEGTHQRLVPQSAPTQLYRLPGTPMPRDQSIYAGVSQPFISQTFGSPFGHVPSHKPFPASPYSHPTASSRDNSIAQTTSPQTFRKTEGFVANDPFRVSHRNEKVDSPSDGLTFDDIPMARSPSGPAPSKPSRSYSLPSMPSQSRYAGTPQHFTSHSLPNILTPQAQSTHAGTPQQFIPQSVPF